MLIAIIIGVFVLGFIAGFYSFAMLLPAICKHHGWSLRRADGGPIYWKKKV